MESLELTSIITSNFEQFEHDIDATQVAGKLQQGEKRCALVFRNNKFLGLVDKRKLLNKDLAGVHIGKCVIATPILEQDATLAQALQLMVGFQVSYLPVERDKKIIGIISALDLLALSSMDKFRVRDVKLISGSSVTADDSINTALKVMHQSELDLLPVYSGGGLSGVISYKSLIRSALNWSPAKDASAHFNKQMRSKSAAVDTESLEAISVESAVEDFNVSVVQQGDPLAAAVAKMKLLRQRSLVVLEGSTYKGMLSVHNILSVLTNDKSPLFDIEYKGLNELKLSEHQQWALTTLVDRQSAKLQRKIKEQFKVTLHIKGHNKEGRQQQFEVKLRIDYPGKLLASEKLDWDLETAVHKCFNIVEGELR